MQNANNAPRLSLLPTPTSAPTGKKRKKNKNKGQQQPAFWARPTLRTILPVPKAKAIQVNKPRLPAPINKAPQETVVADLVDDTSPNVTVPGWKPVGKESKTVTQSKTETESQINMKKAPLRGSRAEKWQQFQAKFLKKEEKKTAQMNSLTKFHAAKPQKSPQQTEANTSRQEICWELNSLDEQDQKEVQNSPQPEPPSKPVQKPEVIQGSASDIKLVLQSKQKAMIIQKPITPKPDDPKDEKVSNPGYSNVDNHTHRDETPKSSRVYVNPKMMADMLKPGSMHHLQGRIPAGVPRTFLMQQQNMGAIQPQSNEPNPGWTHPNLGQTSTYQAMHIQTSNPDTNILQQYSPSETLDQSRDEQGKRYEEIDRENCCRNGRLQEGGSEQRVHVHPLSAQRHYQFYRVLQKDDHEGSESPENQRGQKRLSAFQRLGPLQEQPKKPKLTINLLCNKDQSIREVLDQTEMENKYVPVHQRLELVDSKDETVLKYLSQWPWKRPVACRKVVTARNSKSVMILELEQMEEAYDRDNMFIQVSVKGYPSFWNKEHVLDVVLDAVKGKSFIPCFIEFTAKECKFLVIRSRSALTAIHKIGFYIRKDEVELGVTISETQLGLKQLEFIPRLVLRKRLAQRYDGERKLNLNQFTAKFDISHFIYFPLNRVTNQTELVQLQSAVAWDFLTDLDLSHNRITSLEGFNLPSLTPKLKHLDLSYNYIDKIATLLRCRDLSLRSLKLEGNPLCHDYIDPGHYVKVFRMIFPGLTELDGVPIQLKGEFPPFTRNFCPSDAMEVVGRFLEVFFPLLEAPLEDRPRIANMYQDKASMSVTFRYKLRYSPVYRYFRSLFLKARIFDEGEVDSIDGAEEIAKLISKWPPLKHDPHTFSVDVMHHSEFTTILRVCGLLKLTAESLAEDEQLLAFTRTLVLTTKTGAEYKILNELLYWDFANEECANKAFQINSIRTKPLSLKFESTPDDDLKEKLLEIFIKITDLDKKTSERCLESKEWHLKNALEHFKTAVTQDNWSLLNS